MDEATSFRAQEYQSQLWDALNGSNGARQLRVVLHLTLYGAAFEVLFRHGELHAYLSAHRWGGYRFDLGTVRGIARVTVNGEAVGNLWTPPYLHPGTNILSIAVTNLGWAVKRGNKS